MSCLQKYKLFLLKVSTCTKNNIMYHTIVTIYITLYLTVNAIIPDLISNSLNGDVPNFFNENNTTFMWTIILIQ